jgi:hypothetical protein
MQATSGIRSRNLVLRNFILPSFSIHTAAMANPLGNASQGINKARFRSLDIV